MDVISQLARAGLVLALLAAALWWLRRRGIAGGWTARRQPAHRLECLERLPLGPQHTLHLIRVGETALLVASSPGGCRLVRSFAAREISGEREVGR